MARVAKLIRENIYNIAKPEWLKRALGSVQPLTELIKLTQNDMLFATESLKKQFDADSTPNYDNDTEPMDFSDTVGMDKSDGK